MRSITLIASRSIDHIRDFDSKTMYERPGGPALYCRKALESAGLRVELVSAASKIPIQLHLLYLDEIPMHADFFSIHTCGPFFVWHLRQAVALYGENIFETISGPSDYHLQLSLLQKVQQYTFQLRDMIFKGGRISVRDLHQARKRSIVVLKDLLMSGGTLIQREKEIVQQGIDRFAEFTDEEGEFLLTLVLSRDKLPQGQTKRQFLNECLAIHERAYAIMRMLVTTKTRCKFRS